MSSLQFDDSETIARKIFTFTLWGAAIFAAAAYVLTR